MKKATSLLSRRGTRTFLFALSGALFIAAAVVAAMQWNEGRQAEQNAERLLSAASIHPSASPAPSMPPAGPAETVAYVQPETPDAQSKQEVANLLETELKGYTVIARLDIEKIDQHLPVLSQTSAKALNVSVCYYSGALPGEDGNMVITGHNYKNGAHFGKLDKLKAGDEVTLTDTQGNTFVYTVYGIDHIKPDNAQALDATAHARELTLLTCEANGNGRLVVRCAHKQGGN